ncbi:hypothetical protein DM01DRAFT_1332177 [Hesseltinella vesiculosa]|uniref:Uncharacterized protein n=1 Tax=Hesseltinella vesiculosa TaxID=101127 RepID=A0A1X2GU84_9FUNG|nr:hypothetical protein DM01DRAFT_1332177 [Hesseltinella vesiculosa]
MTDSRAHYTHWSTKNKELIDKIYTTESEIERVKQKIKQGQQTLQNIRQNQEERNDTSDTVQAYVELLERIAIHQPPAKLMAITPSPSASSTTSLASAINDLPSSASSHQHELSEQLMDSIALICHKMERLWAKQLDMTNDPVTSKDRLAYRGFANAIELLLKRQSNQEFLSSADALLLQEIDRLVRLDLGPETLTAGATKDKENAPPSTPPPARSPSPSPSTSNNKNKLYKDCSDRIKADQARRFEAILLLEEQLNQGEKRTLHLEHQLETRIRQLYQDKASQDAHIDYIKAYTDSIGTKAATLATENYVETTTQKINNFQPNGNPLSLGNDQHIPEVMRRFAEIQAKINAVKVASDKYKLKLQRDREMAAKVGAEIDRLKEKASNHIYQLFNEEPMDPIQKKPTTHLTNQLSQLFSSSDGKSQDYIYKQALYLLKRRHLLGKKIPDDTIGPEIAALVLSWSEELQEKGFHVSATAEGSDSVDDLANVVSTMTHMVHKTWDEHVEKQSKFLATKMEVMEAIHSTTEKVETLIKERDDILSGKLASDYTIADRNLEEWFQLLEAAKK